MFYDYSKRGCLLPDGCKDLIDCINQGEDIVLIYAREQEDEYTLKFRLSGLQEGGIEIFAEGGNLHVVGRLPHNLGQRESVTAIPPGYEIAKARAWCIKDALSVFIPKC
jgi:hypothetical protein